MDVLLLRPPCRLPILPRPRCQVGKPGKDFTMLGSIAEAIVAALALFGLLQSLPHVQSRIRLLRERDEALVGLSAARKQLAISEETVRTLAANAEGFRESLDRVSSELAAMRVELAEVKHRLFVAVEYIGALIDHSSVLPSSSPLPPIPESLRDDIEAHHA